MIELEGADTEHDVRVYGGMGLDRSSKIDMVRSSEIDIVIELLFRASNGSEPVLVSRVHDRSTVHYWKSRTKTRLTQYPSSRKIGPELAVWAAIQWRIRGSQRSEALGFAHSILRHRQERIPLQLSRPNLFASFPPIHRAFFFLAQHLGMSKDVAAAVCEEEAINVDQRYCRCWLPSR